ncbi:MAG: hypothetical protein CL946_02690 [Ectothiorhodospiraceae bacterium]|nr:hypothetical protein [Ectothiorhodospiraceae bacterium]
MPSQRYFLIYSRFSLADQKAKIGSLALEDGTVSKLFQAFLTDTVSRFAGVVEASIRIVCGDEKELEYIRQAVPNFESRSYSGETQGDILKAAIDDVLSSGAKQVFVLDSSAPTAPARIVQSGFSLIEVFDNTFTIAPNERGGFYAFGLNSSRLNVLDGIDTTSLEGYEEIIGRICEFDASVYILNSWYSVNSVEDLIQLRGEVQTSDSFDNMLDATLEVLETIPEETLLPTEPKSKKS